MAAARPAGFSDDEAYSDDDFGHQRYSNAATSDQKLHNGAKMTEVDERRNRAFGPTEATAQWSEVDEDVSVLARFEKAIQDDNVEGVTRCLDECGLSVNQSLHCMKGRNPVLVACASASAKVLRLLLERGADTMPDGDGFTPVMYVASTSVEDASRDFERRLVECARLLLEKSPADVNKAQNQRMTPLMMAAKQNQVLLVTFLVERGASLDFRDGQEWSALCFAADKGHGEVARVLLEAGADPDLPTREGKVASEYAGSRFPGLQDVIERFSRKRSLLHGERDRGKQEGGQVRQYSDLDTILLGMGLPDLLPRFAAHNVSLDVFLTLNKADLEKIGIEKVGDVQKILSGISEIHKKDWAKSSIPSIRPPDRQRGICLTCPDCTTIMANVADHLRLLASSATFIRDQIKTHPELLSLGQDIADVTVLATHVRKCRANVVLAAEKLRELEAVVATHAKDKRRRPADLIEKKTSFVAKSTNVLIALSGIGLAMYVTKYLLR